MQNILIFYAKLSHFLCKIVSFFTQNCLIFYANTCTIRLAKLLKAKSLLNIWPQFLLLVRIKYQLRNCKFEGIIFLEKVQVNSILINVT